MPYTSNPHAPKARMHARYDVLTRRLTMAQVARKYGVVRSTIWKWVQKSPHCNEPIYTTSSAPHHHPNALTPEIVARIITLRKQLKRCAPILHAHLKAEGIHVGLSSVERTIRRHRLTRWRKKQASWYTPMPRPQATTPGALVQVDTMHVVTPRQRRFYIYAVIDTFSRLGYAEYHPKLSQTISYEVVMQAQKRFGFSFRMIQTDNGPEFKDGLQTRLGQTNIPLRHSRVRTPNDNAHVERFIRTIQEECFGRRLPNCHTATKQLTSYLEYYNNHRLHLGINCQTPTDFVSKVLK